MDADGKNVKRLTDTPGYDGGAFFSPDCTKIVWRASRPKAGKELDDYKRLLAQGLVRPTQLEIWVANADGSEARQVTYLGRRLLRAVLLPLGQAAPLLLQLRRSQGAGVRHLGDRRRRHRPRAHHLDAPASTASPCSRRTAPASPSPPTATRAQPGETDVFVARWVDRPRSAAGAGAETAAADRFRDDVRWLADDAREGRGIGTAGPRRSAASWLAEPLPRARAWSRRGTDGCFQSFDVPVAVEARAGTAVTPRRRARGRATPSGPPSFSATGEAAGEVVAAGYGITAPELGIDDYKGIDAKGKIVVVRRFTPEGAPFADKEVEQRYGDLRYKAWNAREHGAVGLIVVDSPPAPATPAGGGAAARASALDADRRRRATPASRS